MIEAPTPDMTTTVVLLFAVPLLVMIVGFFLVLPFLRAGKGGGPKGSREGDDRPSGPDGKEDSQEWSSKQ